MTLKNSNNIEGLNKNKKQILIEDKFDSYLRSLF